MDFFNPLTNFLQGIMVSFTEGPWHIIATLIKAFLFSFALVSLIAAILIPIGLRTVTSLINNNYVKGLCTFVCFYMQIWNYGSNVLWYIGSVSAIYLSCYTSQGCWYVGNHFKRGERMTDQLKALFILTLWVVGVFFVLFYKTKISKTIQQENVFVLVVGEIIIALILIFIRPNSIFYIIITISLIGSTIICRQLVLDLYAQNTKLKILNIPFQAIFFNILAVHGRYKEKQLENIQERSEFKDRVFEANIVFFIYCLFTGRYIRYEHYLFALTIYYFIFHKA